MTTGADIVSEAREWIGTRYEHQGRLKGVQVDCVGLIIGVGLNCGVLEWTPNSMRPWAGYARTPHPEKMRAGLSAHLDLITEPRLGDIAWIGWRAHLPMHLAILGDLEGRRSFIHASGDIGRCVEHDVDEIWADRVIEWWRYRGLEA